MFSFFYFDFYLDKKNLIFVVFYLILTVVYKILFQYLLKKNDSKNFLQRNFILFFINIIQFFFSFFIYYLKNTEKNKIIIKNESKNSNNEIPNLKEKINIKSFQDYKKKKTKFYNLKIFSLIFICSICDVLIFNYNSKYFYYSEIKNTNFNNIINFITLIFIYIFNRIFRNKKLFFFNYFCLLIFIITNFFCFFIENEIKFYLFLKYSKYVFFICLFSIKIIFEKIVLDFKVNPFKINCIEGLFEIIIFGFICFVDIFIHLKKQEYKIFYDSFELFYVILYLILIVVVYLHKIIEINLINNYSIYLIFFGYCYFIFLNFYFRIKNFDYSYFFILLNDVLTIFSVFILNKIIILNVFNNEILSKTNSTDENKSNSQSFNNNSTIKSESIDSSYISNSNNNVNKNNNI